MCAKRKKYKKLDFIIYTPLVFLVLGSWFIYGPISSGFFFFQMPLNFMYLIGSMSLPLLNSKYGHFLIRKDDSLYSMLLRTLNHYPKLKYKENMPLKF